MGSDPRSTVGTATDANAMLRILFSRLGKRQIGPPSEVFAFNIASVTASVGSRSSAATRPDQESDLQPHRRHGERCEGRGAVTDFDLSALYDDSKSINRGASRSPATAWTAGTAASTAVVGFFDPDKPIRKYNKRELRDLLHKEPTKIKVEGINLTYAGLIPTIQSRSCPRIRTRCSRTSARSWSRR